MDITNLKIIVANLPNEVTPEQFSLIEQDFEELLAEQRRLDIEALGNYEQRIAKLREKLGLNASQAPPPVRQSARAPSPLDETDAGMGVREPRDEGGSAKSFQDELAELRERTQQKRRRLG